MKKTHLSKWRSRYKEWREDPFTYEKNETDLHVCHNCDNEFVGDFCPTCGLKAESGPITWRTLWQEFLNVWGMGNRSLLFSLWQLLWRPGYFISDYINGKRQVSFPPVKMLFLVGLLVVVLRKYVLPPDFYQTASLGTEEREYLQPLFDFVKWTQEHEDWGMLVSALAMILPTWILYRESPRNTHHSMPQGFFIQVFMCTLMMILSLVNDWFGPLESITLIWILIAYKQLFGYGWWGSIWRTGFVFFCTLIMGVILAALWDVVGSIVRGDSVKIIENLGIAFTCAIVLLYPFGLGTFINKRVWKKHSVWGTIWHLMVVLLLPIVVITLTFVVLVIIDDIWGLNLSSN